MKYTVYRSFGKLDRDIKKHELVAVEYGADIFDVTDKLIKAIEDDLSSSPEYKGCRTCAYPPKVIQPDSRRVKRYQYEISGIVLPPHAPKNIVIEFGVVEENKSEIG